MLFLFRFSELVFMAMVAANSLLGVDNIAQNLAQAPLEYTHQTLDDDDPVFVAAVAKLESAGGYSTVQDYAECDENTNPKVFAICPHTKDTTYMVLMILWGVYFLIFFGLRLFFSWKYAMSDYRFHFYIDQFASHIAQRILVYVGVVFTLATAIVGIVYVTKDWAPESPPAGSIWILIQYALLNIGIIMFDALYARNTDTSLWESEFTEEIPLLELPGGNGFVNVAKLAFKRSDFFTAMQFALADDFAGRGGLDKLTSKPELLRKMMLTLAKTDEDDSSEDDKKKKEGGDAAASNTNPDNNGPSAVVVADDNKQE